MRLVLNKTEIQGHDLKLSATLPLPADDLSGNSSYTETAETGNKPKTLNVTLKVKFTDPADLTTIIRLAEAKTNNGSRLIYHIINHTAEAMNIRQVRFQGDLTVKEDGSLKLWNVMFKLAEMRSVPESIEARLPKQPVTDQPPAGETTASTATAIPTPEQLTSFENVLQWLDTAVAPDAGNA